MLRLVEMKKEEAEHLAEVKSVFLANMSHEIRTPMNAVLGMNEMILRESSEEEIVEYAKNIERAGETLMSLINDVLDISKIESGKIEIHSDEYKLETLVDDLMNLVSVKAEEKGLEIRQEFDQDIPGRLYGDELRIKQILINVLNNAIKYTDKGTITFGLSWEQTEPDSMLLKIRVTDTGIGMKEEELKHIFDAFQRLDEKAFFQRGEERLWLIRHFRKRARLLFMQPFEKLFCAKRGLPHFLHQFRKLRLGI